MAHEHPDAPQPLGIHHSEDTIRLVSENQHFRQRSNQAITLCMTQESA
ncbi:hypothetical protein KBY70_04600 [Cyanobium sp. ATX 6E8]|nr:hypothetical protein [Cyanobium sp. ATX 6E8]MCP9941675.1 hypothetical protein [Cyanobium sp. ATX 6E8]